MNRLILELYSAISRSPAGPIHTLDQVQLLKRPNSLSDLEQVEQKPTVQTTKLCQPILVSNSSSHTLVEQNILIDSEHPIIPNINPSKLDALEQEILYSQDHAELEINQDQSVVIPENITALS